MVDIDRKEGKPPSLVGRNSTLGFAHRGKPAHLLIIRYHVASASSFSLIQVMGYS